MFQLSHPYMTPGKTIALTLWIFVHKVMSLPFKMLSRFVTAFLPKSKHLLISWLQSPSAVILEPPKIKSVTVPITSWQIDGETLETAADFIFGGSKITAEGDCSHEKTLTLWKKSYDQPRQYIKKQRQYFTNIGLSSQGRGFSSGHVWM